MLTCGRVLSSSAGTTTASFSPLRTLTRSLLRRPPPRFLSSSSAAAATAVELDTKGGGGAGGGGGGGAARPQWKAAIDFKWIRDNRDAVAANIQSRNSAANLDLVLQLYDQYLALQKEVERLRAERNAVANKMKGKLDPSVRQALVEEGKNLKEELIALEEDLVHLSDKLQLEAQSIPNATHPDVPVGGEESSVVRKEVGSQRSFNFTIKDHLQLGKELDLFDFDAAAEVSGSKFYYLKNEAVLLEMALVNWAISEVSKKGFTPLITPEIVRSSVVEKCGFQPRAQNTQVYSIDDSDQCLIGTAEIPVGGIHMDSILPESALPLKYVAYSHCFRTEAGAAGAATRGLYRVHQFSKVEMFIFCRPEESDKWHEELITIEEDLYASLGLHFKTLDMATGDLGAPAYRKFDIEAWMPGLDRYGEISSASNCTDYQSRRLSIRYRPSPSESPPTNTKKGKGAGSGPTQFVHTLNATAVAVPRLIVCILENFQQDDGSIVIPEPLRPFMGGLEVLSPKSK
ncbi:serine--tRNA ligase, chloroplastic/mitochondrial isoform X1 [Phragmites australis]|uniref:serine--tRNA ligase, chloroplastic/mitochondrial isoform X1 n=2 Tax=Phragmites australis TaxID=29695 RepID=UPI002D78D8FD|nr:serine--tRNA ligase, chloroplastic/mitochondrial isoform X1 [Phragmites australis]